jgi:hypothetical protein
MLAHEFFPADARALKILDFDIENRPLTYWREDRPTAEITSIASCWHGDMGTLTASLLGVDDPEQMLVDFVKRYDEADIVTGHYIRKHDLPIINGALMEYGLPQLRPKLTQDTMLDLFVKADIPSSQEYLCEVLDISVPKVHMTQHDWREANRLLPKGLAKTYRRVTGDVLQHMLMRAEMVRRGMLRPPTVWNPGGGERPDDHRHKRG